MNISKSEFKRDIEIDILKATACIAVVGLHTVGRNVGVANSLMYYLCGFAVPIFFMVNGYLILDRKIDFRYVCRKVVTLLKIVAIWNMFLFFIYIIKGTHQSYLKLLISSLIQNGYMSHLWFLWALMICYFLAPILCRTSTKTKMMLFGVGCIICTIIAIIACLVNFPIQKYIPQTFRLWTWLTYYLSGGCIKVLLKKIKRIPTSVVAITTVLAVLTQFILAKYVVFDDKAEYYYDFPVIMWWCIIIFIFFLQQEIRGNICRIMLTISNNSMGVYILHMLLTQVVSSVWKPSNILAGVLYWIVISIISIFITMLFKKFRVTNFLIST